MAGCVFMFLLAMAPFFVSGYAPSDRYLEDNCGGTMSFSQDVILEYSSYRNTIPSNYRCQVTFQSRDRSKRVQLRFRYLDTPRTTQCTKVAVIIYDGSTTNSPLTPRNGVCGSVEPTVSYRSTGDTATVLFANNGLNTYGDFELLLTSFYTAFNGSCRGDDFQCNNGLCVTQGLTCNGYNDCGDHSDEEEGCNLLAAGAIVGIVFGVLIFVSFCTVFGVCVRRRRRSYIRVTETVREYPIVQAQPAGSYVPSYGNQTGTYQAI